MARGLRIRSDPCMLDTMSTFPFGVGQSGSGYGPSKGGHQRRHLCRDEPGYQLPATATAGIQPGYHLPATVTAGIQPGYHLPATVTAGTRIRIGQKSESGPYGAAGGGLRMDTENKLGHDLDN